MQTPHKARHPWLWINRRLPPSMAQLELSPEARSPHDTDVRLIYANVLRGSVNADLVGGRTGSWTAVGAGASPDGPAALFDGASSGIAYEDEAAWDFTSLSILCGFTPRAIVATGFIVGRWDDVGVNKRCWAISITSSGLLRADTSSDGLFDANARAELPTALVAGRRYVAITQQGGGVATQLAIDGGKQVDGAAASTASTFDTDIGFEIGSAEFDGASRVYFDGTIDFVFIWSGIVTANLLFRWSENPSLLIQPAYTPMGRRSSSGRKIGLMRF